MSAQAPNPRASLLAGLRTGGVRSSSAAIPHTAAPGGSFNVPRMHIHQEDLDQLPEIAPHFAQNRTIPATAAVDVPNNMFLQQQRRPLNPNSLPFSPGFKPHNQAQAQAQAFQLQMMQLELMKIQAMQAQAEIIAQAQRQPQVQNQRLNPAAAPPATAGPLSTSFDLRTATLRRANQADQLRAQLGVARGEDNVPMTAALGGKFGSRSVSTSAAVPITKYDQNEDANPPHTPSSTTIISGGTSLGSPMSNNTHNNVPSKSDSAASWRRSTKSNSVLGGNRSFTSPSVKITPPPPDRLSPPPESAESATPNIVTPSSGGPKFRPQPLRFSAAVSQPLPVVAIDSNNVDDNDDASSTSSSKSNSNSSPTTPQSSSSNEMPLSPREEASKKLYEGLGIGRPASAVGNGHPTVTVSEHVEPYSYQVPAAVLMAQRVVSQPMRQPRGPPSGADELGPKNFATRIRRKAIGGLGMLMDARERREIVEAF